MSPFQSNSVLGDYKVGGLLGEGAMGRVYAGEKAGLGPVAFKVPIAVEFEPMLLAEAEALKKVDHPNIVPYVDWLPFDGGHALVMGFVDGESLEERFDQRPLSAAEVHNVATKLADALATAHRGGVVHRDLKPANIKLRSDGEPVLLDFGAAASLDAIDVDPVGTLSYMSPEQVMGQQATPASDQFSLGVVLYEAISGRRPFTGFHAAALEYEICNEDPPPLHEVNSSISESVSTVIGRLLAKSADLRFPSLEAFLLEWEEAQKAGGGAATQRLVVSASNFTNEMGDPAADFIGRAIADGVSASLRSLEGLVLVARETVAAQEKALNDKISAAGMVGAEYLAAGRYLVMGDQMQITAEITRVADRSSVFSQQYRGGKDQLFELQDQIAARIATHFRTLLPEQATAEGVADKVPDPAVMKLYREARELYFRGGRENLEQAIELCEEAVDTDPEFAAAQAALADCYINMYMWRIDPRPIWLNRGEKAAQKALDTNPNSAPAHRSLGRVYQHRREYDKAEEYFNKAVQIDSKYSEAMCSLGWLHSEKKEFDRALHWAGEALKVSPSNPDASLLRGLAYLDQRNYANAERTFREIARLHPDYGRGHLYLGETLQKEGRFEEAKEAFVAAMTCDDFDPEALRDLGRLELYLQQWDNARKTFLQAIHEQVFEFAANYYLGMISRMQGDEAAAQAAWQNAQVLAERVLTKDPNDHYARLFLGLAKAARGDRSGYDDIQAVRKVEPNHGELAFFEASAAQLLGDYDQAEACVFEATQLPLGPSSAECAADPHFLKVPAGA